MPPHPPPVDQIGTLSQAAQWLYDWASIIGWGFLTGILVFVWRVSARITGFEEQQKQHTADIRELKVMREATTAKIETLATKDDLSDATSAITGELRSRMADMTQLIVRTGK